MKYKWKFISSSTKASEHQILTGNVESTALINEARFLKYSISNADGGNNGCCIESDGAEGAPVAVDSLSKQCQNGRGKFGTNSFCIHFVAGESGASTNCVKRVCSPEKIIL